MNVVYLAVAIYATYLVYGVAQEKIYKTAYAVEGGSEGETEKFAYTLFAVAVQCVFNAATALAST